MVNLYQLKRTFHSKQNYIKHIITAQLLHFCLSLESKNEIMNNTNNFPNYIFCNIFLILNPISPPLKYVYLLHIL